MNPEQLEQILREVSTGARSVEDALVQLRRWPLEDLGFARIDHHRNLRRGFPEVIFAQGKRPAETEEIAAALIDKGSPLLVTRAGDETLARLQTRFPQGQANERARTFTVGAAPEDSLGQVTILAAGTSDISVAEEAAVTARTIGATVETIYDVGVAGLHRLLPHMETLERAHAIVVVAGMEGALASVVAGLVGTPVIAVPTSVGYGASFGGISALLGMLTSCASGVVVVNIDNGFGGGFAAALICRSASRAAEAVQDDA
ncbi:nickel pincer cofactor biosynthesis protein LarB [Candidatus Eisenbacteria bacterium]|uniref:Nickel pincer cofactor biosynthesis protein LarB n=1 Tax=Eiseniibacteriota bacterium TaxID=2212470 RepID=A0ABV6YKQ1_UNCEI